MNIVGLYSEETLKGIYKINRENEKLKKENERLHNIIKEVREYLEIFTSFDECTINGRVLQKAIDILDKENKE